jgi:hypothetical protein
MKVSKKIAGNLKGGISEFIPQRSDMDSGE